MQAIRNMLAKISIPLELIVAKGNMLSNSESCDIIALVSNYFPLKVCGRETIEKGIYWEGGPMGFRLKGQGTIEKGIQWLRDLTILGDHGDL